MNKVKFNKEPAIDPSHDEFETKGHLNTLMDAEKIKSDPTKMAKVAKMAGVHHKMLKKIKKTPVRSTDDLKQAGNNFSKKGQSGYGEPDGDDAA